MNLLTLLDMSLAGHGDRVLLGPSESGLTPVDLQQRARSGAQHLVAANAETVVYLGENGLGFPIALFAAAIANVPFLPLNYRLAREQLVDVVEAQNRPYVISEDPSIAEGAHTVDEWLALTKEPGPDVALPGEPDTDAEAVLLLTSGTTAAPKSAVLRHRHLAAYVLDTVEFSGAAPTDAVVVSVPPYHIAAVANLLSNLYSGRRIVYLDKFTPEGWIDTVAEQGVTHAMVVPTMLSRIVDALEAGTDAPTTLRSLSYGGAPLAPSILQRALALLPDVGFVNAYGLTETSSSIAVLGPDDHRTAAASDDPAVRARLGSVGRPLPSVEIQIRNARDEPAAPGEVGAIFVRGPQVAGEYRQGGSRMDAGGWFPTRDEGYLDADGFLFVKGRSDDTIIRGGENIAPAEIEDVIQQLPGVAEAVVVGIPDEEWGQRIGAFIIRRPGADLSEDGIREYVRSVLRSSKTPDVVTFVDELPRTPTGKILRRQLIAK
ncbi:class I adenylate-forming enzyme family protein [Cryptosporangium phraense]|uniref:Long-chain fatty acid--CoA ligase n=1 Tax=Cryptosporangium phraense TaxID=2593070 RepID=A0A545B052_9ACTN|nr:fatty acid--CoA ligase family protein [Cryptosporangium phraense]TQS46966.1 long-chain fatty acid--CoA ligase [Cryptosporangium phraense]